MFLRKLFFILFFLNLSNYLFASDVELEIIDQPSLEEVFFENRSTVRNEEGLIFSEGFLYEDGRGFLDYLIILGKVGNNSIRFAKTFNFKISNIEVLDDRRLAVGDNLGCNIIYDLRNYILTDR